MSCEQWVFYTYCLYIYFVFKESVSAEDRDRRCQRTEMYGSAKRFILDTFKTVIQPDHLSE